MKNRPKLGELLVEAGAVDEAQLTAALAEQRKWGHPLGMTLVEMRMLDEETLVRTLARQLRIPVVWLRGKAVRPEVLALVPPEIAEKHRCMPVLLDERGAKTLVLAMEDPADVAAIDQVAFLTGLEVKPVLAAPGELGEAIQRHYPSGRVSTGSLDLNDAIFAHEDLGAAQPELLSLAHPEVQSSAPLDIESEAPATQSAPGPVASDGILRALTQLLVEKGVITRDELVERLKTLEAGDDGGEP